MRSKQHITRLPGDSFFLRRLSAEEADGYVVYLRLIREVNKTAIALRQPDLLDSATVAQRVGTPPYAYVYALTHQLVGVFAAIGLPAEYSTRKDVIATVLRPSFLGPRNSHPA